MTPVENDPSTGPACQPGSWAEALARAGTAAAEVGRDSEGNFDFVAIRGVIAVALHGLAFQDAAPVAAVGWGPVLWYIDDVAALTDLADKTSGPADSHGDPARPWTTAGRMWAWLLLDWPDPQARPMWGGTGMTRSIARGRSDPALVIHRAWAGNAVARALSEQLGGLPKWTRVKAIAGPHAGACGYIGAPAFQLDDTARTVLPGPVRGYTVRLDGVGGEPLIPAEHLSTDADGLSWPQQAPAAYAPAGRD